MGVPRKGYSRSNRGGIISTTEFRTRITASTSGKRNH